MIATFNHRAEMLAQVPGGSQFNHCITTYLGNTVEWSVIYRNGEVKYVLMWLRSTEFIISNQSVCISKYDSIKHRGRGLEAAHDHGVYGDKAWHWAHPSHQNGEVA